MYPGNFLRAINRLQQFSRRFASFEVEKKSDHFIFKKFSKDVTQSTEVTFNWIRDHSRSFDHYNHRTHQRIQNLSYVVCNSNPIDHSISEDQFLVKWSDGSISKYSLEWIFKSCSAGQEQTGPKEFLWCSHQPPDMNTASVDFEDYMNKSGSGLSTGIQTFLRYGFLIVKNSPKTLQATSDVSKRLGPVLQTPFGDVWSFSSTQPDSVSDSAYSQEELRPHNDGTYFANSPGIQVFHCLKAAQKGGDTILVDGFHVAQELKSECPMAYDFFSSIDLEAEYIHTESEPQLHLLNRDKVFRHSKGKLVQVRYNIYDRAPHDLNLADQRSLYKYLPMLERLVNKKENQITLCLTPGNVLLVNNWRVMHGRTSFLGNERVMSGCYVNKEALESKARVLRII